ncbi:response regulator [Cerasicoccus arenae]|uniref:response regulator n=1 Tax=Cerasicoccus arenae TaxID=424488 RepID=UPI0019046296|nr:response regulator [Cerasicoccus arenae]MBK1857516.1 response regulator [Cerasicoccus arenae]
MKILYWDDSEAVLENVTKKLVKLCHKVVPARTLEDCKAALEDKDAPVDLFIADYKIDEKDGMNFIMGAKATDPELHVVVLTPSILRSEFNQLQMCGIEILKKPILLDQVVRPFLAPDKRRKKTMPPMPVPESTEKKGSGLLGIQDEDKTPSEVAVEERPEGMPPPPGVELEPKKRKGLTRLFARS